MAHNTLISDGPGPARFLRVWADRLPPGTPVQAVNNLSIGRGVFAPGVPGDFAGNHPAARRMLVDPDRLDFALQADSPLRGRGVDPRRAFNADLSPQAEFKLPVGTRALPEPSRWSPGAFQR